MVTSQKASAFTDTDRDAVVVAACRTPIGKLRGALSSVRPDDLLALSIAEALKRSGVDGAVVDEVIAGCANQAGEDNRNVARMATLLAGLPQSVPAVTVNRLCASGLEAIVQASRAIRLGDADVVVAGGVESMSRAPWVMAKPDSPFPTGAPAVFDSSLGWRFPNPRMEKLFPLEQMGETAENLVDELKISRADQDAFAVRSHQRAVAATTSKKFAREIVPVTIPGKRGAGADVVVDDEQPRADTSLEALAKLKPAFRKEGGSVTAGNSSTLNDGSAAVVVVARAFARAHGLPVLGTIRGSQSAGVNPRTMGIGPVPAVQKLLARLKLTTADLRFLEVNEAFAAQSLAVVRTLGLSESEVEAKVNVRGGAIALGHPLGCSGARITATMLSILQDEGGGLGLLTLCVGVGQGLAVVVEVQA
ncbi:MAG: acetyl-CoA C-acyltransferase [Deltaproteobacteria bacterium]|nr:acetyl-CoA C-acyltransferase [Deltaproteobacteria bacterium]